MPKGVRLSDEDRRTIAELTAQGYDRQTLASRFGVSTATISHIRREQNISDKYFKGGRIATTMTVKQDRPETVAEEPEDLEPVVIVNHRTIEWVGFKTMFRYKASTVGKKITIEAGDRSIEVESKDLLAMVDELANIIPKFDAFLRECAGL